MLSEHVNKRCPYPTPVSFHMSRLLGAGLRGALSHSRVTSKLPTFTPAVSGLQTRFYRNGTPLSFIITFDDPRWDPEADIEYEMVPRDVYGCPATVPPELSTQIAHTYYVPPAYFPFLKKLGDDTPELKPYTDKLINGQMTFDDYEEMFYLFAKPLRIHRSQIPKPYRTDAELAREDEVAWEGAWLSFRQRVMGDYYAKHHLRDMLFGISLGAFLCTILVQQHRQYRVDMKLYYLEAPEHKINWVKPRGDL